MPRLINIPTFRDERGSLSVIEEQIGFAIRRVFYIYDVSAPRGGHGHKRSKTALIALSGSVEVFGQTPEDNFSFMLERPEQCLLLEPEDWHKMNFSPGAVLLVLASELFQKDDYFYEPYRKMPSE